jgi:hypothetical protein
MGIRDEVARREVAHLQDIHAQNLTKSRTLLVYPNICATLTNIQRETPQILVCYLTLTTAFGLLVMLMRG